MGQLSEAPTGVGLRPKCWGVARSNVGAARWHRLVRDAARLAETRAGWPVVAFALLRLKRFLELIV